MADREHKPAAPHEKDSQALAIELETPFGRLRGRLALPAGPMRLAELAWNALGLGGRLIAMAVATEQRHGRTVSCAKGCAACCRQAVPVSPPEAWMLWDTLASFPAERRKATLERFADVKAQLMAEGFGERSLSDANVEQVQRLGLDYLRLRLPCPFLQNECCSIYAQRPSSCREYLVSSPPSWCDDPGRYPVRPVAHAASLTEALAQVYAAVTGATPKVMPLVTAPDWAEEHQAEGMERYDPVMLITLLVQNLSQKQSNQVRMKPST